MQLQKPTLGRIVLYRLGDDAPAINGGRVFPAMVVREPSAPDPSSIGTAADPNGAEVCYLVNLRVFTDGDDNVWLTSVPLYDAGHELCGTPGTCYWPARS